MEHSRTVIEGWPTLMSGEMAARYMSLDEESFIRITTTFKAQPVDLDLDSARWRKADLDALVKRLPSAPSFLLSDRKSHSSGIGEREIQKIAEAVAKQLGGAAMPSQRALVSIKEAGAVLGLARTTIYRLIKEGQLSTRKIGRRTLIPVAEIQDILENA